MKKTLASLLLLCVSGLFQKSMAANTQEMVFKFWVELKDKTGTPFTLLRPWDFLSERSLLRRQRNGVPVTMEDLPVAPAYIQELKDCGVKVQLVSRWMNAALVETTDSSLAAQMEQETFVKKVTLMGFWSKSRGAASVDPDAFTRNENLDYSMEGHIAIRQTADTANWNDGYGLGWDQLSMLNVQQLHHKGYRGKGVWIAVLDAGFFQANYMAAFDSLRANHRILGSKDFVDLDNNVYNDDDHGTQVLSCMACNVPGIMVGTAPEASYLLLRTEDARSEYPAEEAQWLAGIEYADSMGVDVVNSSLGYTEFDNPVFGHTYSELDGKTALITQAANKAFERGMVLINSAGNEGDSPWEKIGAPADAKGVLAVAAVDAKGFRADFSSMGPTYDKRTKPDIAAMGKRTMIAGSSGYFYGSNGTSYSAPVMTGAVACLVGAYPNAKARDLYQVIRESGNQYLAQDDMLGSGIPDFNLAFHLLGSYEFPLGNFSNFLNEVVTADSISAPMEIKFSTSVTDMKTSIGCTLTCTADGGDIIVKQLLLAAESGIYAARIEFPAQGWYTIHLENGNTSWSRKIYYKKPQD